MLDSKTFVQLGNDLKDLGLDSDFTPVSSYPKVEVKIDLKTLLSLVERAKTNRVIFSGDENGVTTDPSKSSSFVDRNFDPRLLSPGADNYPTEAELNVQYEADARLAKYTDDEDPEI